MCDNSCVDFLCSEPVMLGCMSFGVKHLQAKAGSQVFNQTHVQ